MPKEPKKTKSEKTDEAPEKDAPKEGITPENVENFDQALDKIFGKRKDEDE